MQKTYRYTLPHQYFACEVVVGSLLPGNSTTTPPPTRPWPHVWPRWTGEEWVLEEDHRERNSSGGFGPEDEQAATDYWLAEDDYTSPARTMKKPGPLPEGATLTRPEKPLAAYKDEQRAAFDAAFAELDRRRARPAAAVSEAAALGLEPDPADVNILGQLNMVTEENRELRSSIDAADTIEAVQAIAPWLPWEP